MFDKGLGATVNVAAGIGIIAGHGTKIDDVALITLHHAGQDGPGYIQEAFNVGVNHGLPVVHVRFLGLGKAKGESGIVDQDVDGAELFREFGNALFYPGSITHIKNHAVDGNVGVGRLEFFQPFAPSAGNDELPAFFGKSITAGKAETGRCAGNQDSFLHGSHQEKRKITQDSSPKESRFSRKKQHFSNLGWKFDT